MNKTVDWAAAFDKLPMTQFLIALYKMTPEQRAKASPERAAARYGIKVETARFNIEEARKCPDVWPITGGANNARRTRSRR